MLPLGCAKDMARGAVSADFPERHSVAYCTGELVRQQATWSIMVFVHCSLAVAAFGVNQCLMFSGSCTAAGQRRPIFICRGALPGAPGTLV